MILEGLVTTVNADGRVNLSPMGPRVRAPLTSFTLKPYRTSTTYANLKRKGEGVLHVTDDVELLALCAVGAPDPLPAMRRAEVVDGWIVSDACRWHAFRVASIDDSQERSLIEATVVDSGVQREFFGFNRAKHAVLEAAILATRVEFLPPDEIREELRRLAPLVEKTGGPAEERAFKFLQKHVFAKLATASALFG